MAPAGEPFTQGLCRDLCIVSCNGRSRVGVLMEFCEHACQCVRQQGYSNIIGAGVGDVAGPFDMLQAIL